MSGETANSDFYGIVLNAAVAAMDGCPWIEKGRVLQIADGIAETVTDRLAHIESVDLPNGQRFENIKLKVDLTSEEAAAVSLVVVELTALVGDYKRALRQARRQIEMFMDSGKLARLTVAQEILEQALEKRQ